MIKNRIKSDKISLLGAVSIGIGGMVGGGIFAVLGLAVSMAQGATPIAFLVAGLITLITAYSYQKLSVRYPDHGGTVRFINEGFGISLFSGTVNNLLWVNYIIMLALYASAFGSYAPNIFPLTDSLTLDSHIYASGILILSAGINYYSLSVVGVIESFAVVIKLFILLVFVILCGYGLTTSEYTHQLSVSNWVGPTQLIAGGMVIFVAYEGFELIANSTPDIENPQKNISRAYFISVFFVVALYVIIAIITVGSLSFETIANSEEYVLAEAAKPVIGDVGFKIITLTALISTFSAINATVLGSSRVNYEVAKDKELFPYFTRQFHGKPIGLVMILVLSLVLVNTLKIDNVSIAGSIGFLLVFSVVNYAAFKKSKEVQGNKWLFLVGTAMTLAALVILLVIQWESNLLGIGVFLILLTFCLTLEKIYRLYYKK